MSRAVKFRVWRTGSHYDNVPPVDASGIWTARLVGPGQWDQYGISLRADGSLFVPQRDGYPEEVVPEGTAIVMQSTGAIDRNGVEIYEGDLVEYFNWCYASRHSEEPTPLQSTFWHGFNSYYAPLRGIVAWDQEAATWAPTITSQEDYNRSSFLYVCHTGPVEPPTDYQAGYWANYPSSYVEVLGNIYEHPHLIPAPSPTGE